MCVCVCACVCVCVCKSVSPLTSQSLAICRDCIVGKCLIVVLTCCGYPENAEFKQHGGIGKRS